MEKTFNELMRDALAMRKDPKPSGAEQGTTLDSAGGDFDSDGDYDVKRLALAVGSSVQTWAEDDDLADGETYADRLFALLLGIVDENKDGELSDDEQEEFSDVCEYAGQYLARHGVDEDDAATLLSEWDDDTAERVRDVLVGNLPEGDDAAKDINDFAFGGNTMDSANDITMDKAFQTPTGHKQVTKGKNKAVYKTVVVVRGGQKTFARKRVSGKVRLSPAQKASIAKARIHSKTAQAIRNWRKSMGMRKQLGVRNLSRKSTA